MKKRTHSLLSDIAFQIILVLMFVGIILLAIDNSHLTMNGVLLCVAMALFMITYFTSMRTGLILNFLFIFLLLAYVTFQAVGKGIKITANIYFWMFWPLFMVISISVYVRQHQLLDKENENLREQIEKFVTIDDLTQMNNLLAFERDAKVYMNISRRYKLDLVLMLWRLTYQDDLERLLGEKTLQDAMSDISDSIKNALRKEDLVYLVEKEPFIWGTLQFSKPDSGEVVIQHVSEAVKKTDLTEYTDQKDLFLEIESTIIIYDGTQLTPLSLLSKAKKQMWKEERLNNNYMEEEVATGKDKI